MNDLNNAELNFGEKHDGKLSPGMKLVYPDDVEETHNISTPCLVLNTEQAARLLGISTRHLWSLTNQKLVPSLRMGKCVRYSFDLLRTFVVEQSQKKAKHR